ncbi:ribosomal protein YmL31 precursor [Chlamydia pneumoniae TW-183]|uniref:Uncharacterized protein n=3 Tax=Chlamydia pneumoniae TaxID=83558 RepID=Q9Z917_CHLPN|nr:hypothetical protein CPn_0167 [Chlamydia pneumoniae CWL029]AAF38420.1 hypothetical protein CP_0604 [Chlamydia pneumoniae AR39]AAP98101.1 ribosomal protein YmL31 precursor [Chlamydia pneumoniae TW-183]BAA98377.1 hypothetical protein [Chlamydia pneumoniae J138]
MWSHFPRGFFMLPFCPTILLAKPFLNSENYGLERLAATVDSYFDLGQSQIVFLSKQDQGITVEELSAKDRKFKPGSMNCTLYTEDPILPAHNSFSNCSDIQMRTPISPIH